MHRRRPPLESLRIFEACARLQNFTRAAVELGITPAAVSFRIRDLEAELGCALFRRNGPKIRSTATGERLATRLAQSFEAIDGALDELRREAGTIRLSAVPTLAAQWLPQALGGYGGGAGQPRIEVEVSDELRSLEQLDIVGNQMPSNAAIGVRTSTPTSASGQI